MQGHTTYASPLIVAVTLQPVQWEKRIGLLVVQRNIEPYQGEFALPGGFADAGETGIKGASREKREETPLPSDPESLTYFSETVGGSHNSKDPRCHAIYFYTAPLVDYAAIDFSFSNKEVKKLAVLFLANNMTHLETYAGAPATLCFETHHNAALRFLQLTYAGHSF